MSVPSISLLAVSRQTGLSPHVIRAWERRYGAVEPSRSGTNRRLYSQEETDRLGLLAKLTRAGHSIGNIARLEKDELSKLAESLPKEKAPPAPSTLMERGLDAISKLDAGALERIFQEGAVELGAHGVVQRLIAPLCAAIGERWRDGQLTAAHEHFASAVLRTFLGYAIAPFTQGDNAPVIIVSTPLGQLHELGALMAGAVAASLGWNVAYLGPALPAAEIAGAARQRKARAIALSLIYPEDDARLPRELERLRAALGPEVPILIGGRAAPAYEGTLKSMHALHVTDLDQFGRALDELRKPR